MRHTRAIIEIPKDLATEVDRIAGPGNRSKFVTELLNRELRRVRLLEILGDPEPIWKASDHPDIAAIGEVEWVRQLRQEGETRFQKLVAGRDNENKRSKP